MTSFASSILRLRTIGHKFSWGIRVVGPVAAIGGAFRLLKIWLARPDHGEVHLRSSIILEFDYPDQFPPTLMMFGDLIDPEFAFLQRVGRPGWRVIDVGAAIGQFSLFAATALPGSRVEAFEPSSANVETLNRNISRNGVAGRVTVHRTALSNRKETARFATAPKNWMSQLVSGDGGDIGTEEVPVDTLDATLDQLGVGHVDILKINVAGYEPAVMEGAMQSLRAGRVDILVLLLGLPSLPHYAGIAALGYRFFYYHPARHLLFEVDRFDADSVLGHRPWPARHILAIRSSALSGIIAGRVEISSPPEGMVLGGELSGPPPKGI